MILCGGDSLIDMVPSACGVTGSAFKPVVGGSCLNVAVALARLGIDCGFVGGISSDAFGQMIRQRLSEAGVDLQHANASDMDTTLAFVTMAGRDAQYLFYDAASAARAWRFEPDEFNFHQVDAVHIGSVTLIEQPSASSFEAFAYLAQSRCVVSFDPNCRPTLIRDKKSYRKRMDSIARRSDIVRLSEEDCVFLHANEFVEDVATRMLSNSTTLVILTRGCSGVTAFTRNETLEVPARVVEVVDTIGAGDTFQAALLAGLSKAKLLDRKALSELRADDLRPILTYAVAAAARTCERIGADPPFHHELLKHRVEAMT